MIEQNWTDYIANTAHLPLAVVKWRLKSKSQGNMAPTMLGVEGPEPGSGTLFACEYNNTVYSVCPVCSPVDPVLDPLPKDNVCA